MIKRIYDYPEGVGLVVCGDIHGKFDELVYRMTVRNRMEHMLVVVAGDCGFGFHQRMFYDEVYKRVLPRLEKADCYVAFVRGNHDNPAYFDGKEIDLPRFRAVPDYSVLRCDGHQVLCVGGATSVDRRNRESYIVSSALQFMRLHETAEMRRSREDFEYKLRLEPADYWPHEQPRFDTDALNAIREDGLEIDTVVTHVAPSMCEDVTPPSWLDYLIENDPKLPDDMRHDRDVMDDLLARLDFDGHPLRHWFYGHYHHSWQAEIKGIIYTMLAEMEMKEVR